MDVSELIILQWLLVSETSDCIKWSSWVINIKIICKWNFTDTDMLLSLAPLTFRKSATRPWCHSQAGVGLCAVASWLLQRRPNRTSSLDTGAVAESPQCGSTGCGRPGTTGSRDSPLRAALVADCCAYWLQNLPSGTQVVCWPSTWLHYRTVDTCSKRSFAVITEIIKQQQPDRSAG